MVHADAVTALATGFERQLLGWWAHMLSPMARTNIINHTKTITTIAPLLRIATNSSTHETSPLHTITTSLLDSSYHVLCYIIVLHRKTQPLPR